MGLLSKFKKSEKQISNTENNKTNQNLLEENSLNQNYATDGKLMKMSNGNYRLDYYDYNTKFGKYYDTTRLIIGKEPINIGGHLVYNCAVSWYGMDDCQIMDKKTGILDSQRAQAYRGVLAEIDLDLLQNDPDYCNAVMTKLLDQMRVEKYLDDGLKENPEIPCGKYVGGIRKTEKGYEKFFSTNIGKASHNSKLMKDRREEYNKRKEEQQKRIIEEKRAQIEKLQSEIEGMEH